jgi:hypothetical protein
MSRNALKPTTKRSCVICGWQADMYDSERRIAVCDLHAEDLREQRPWTLENVPGEVEVHV